MIKSRKNIPIRAVFYVVILIFVMIQVYPIFWVICSSLKTPDEMTYTAQYALPSGFYLGNYISARSHPFQDIFLTVRLWQFSHFLAS